jgi:O-antigen ligase
MYAGLIGLLSIGVSSLTGERTHFLIRACGGLLAGIVWKPKFLMFSILVGIEIIAVFAILMNRPDLTSRFGKQFFKSVPIVNFDTVYWGSWRGGIQQSLLTPLKGIGPSGTRNTCINLEPNSPSWLPGKNNCGNHPHNFYIQLFAETGIIGLLLGIIMFSSIIWACIKARTKNFECPMAATAFVVPLALFFPLQQFGSFYGQWGNLFIWFAIAFALSQYQGWRNTNSNFEK